MRDVKIWKGERYAVHATQYASMVVFVVSFDGVRIDRCFRGYRERNIFQRLVTRSIPEAGVAAVRLAQKKERHWKATQEIFKETEVELRALGEVYDIAAAL